MLLQSNQARAKSHSVEQSLAINISEARIDKKIVSTISIPKYPTMVQLNKTTPRIRSFSKAGRAGKFS